MAPDKCFDRLTRLAAAHFHVPIALISLIDEDGEVIRSQVALEGSEISREVSFGSPATLAETTLVVLDAQADPRFSDNPLVPGPPGVRFYAGAPMISRSGLKLGTLCIMDTQARSGFGPTDVAFLEDLAAIAMDRFEVLGFVDDVPDFSKRRALNDAQSVDATVATAPPTTVAEAARNRARILVAEDNPVTQKVLELALGRLGFAVDLVANGKAAVDAFQRAEYAAIVMDCEMAEMDGIEAAREIRRLEGANRGVVIVALTANTDLGEREKCLKAGMDDHINKPVRLEVLAERLGRWLVPGDSSVKGNDTHTEEIRDFIAQEVQTHFHYLLEMLDRKNIAELVASFVSTTPPLVEELAAAAENNDIETALRAAHSLRGSLGTMGLNRLESSVRRLEELLRANRPHTNLLAEILSHLEIGMDVLRSKEEVW